MGTVDHAEEENHPGSTVGRYRIVRRLGVGGLGSVWLGVHEVIDSKVAIKVLHHDSCVDPDLVQRFVVEAKAVNRIDSPYIVKVFDFGRLADGRNYAVMEYLEGETLREHLLREGKLAWPTVREIALRVCAALEAAHQRGVVHRDLKPDNVFLCRRPRSKRVAVKVLDFGIAKLTGDSSVTTRAGYQLGTPTFAAPEQLQGERSGTAADVYSAGVLLYEMLSGSVPFSAAEATTTKLVEAAPPLPDTVAGLPEGVRPLVTAMLARAPEARPGISEVLAGLRRIAAGDARILTTGARLARSALGPQVALVALCGLLAGVAVGLTVYRRGSTATVRRASSSRPAAVDAGGRDPTTDRGAGRPHSSGDVASSGGATGVR